MSIKSSQYNEYRSIVGALRSLVKIHGLRGLFQGFTATAARDAPYAGVSTVFYEKGKDLGGELIISWVGFSSDRCST
jgi:solute carrier family 25 protein 38